MAAAGVIFFVVIRPNLEYFSQIGTVMLIGLVTKNGILIVEFVNYANRENPNWKLF
jgi:HAE1 family hydrophobic/amphiphilic exporter-1/multidrug efflux pump